MVFEKTLESPLDCKEIQPVHPKGNQSWIFIGRADAKAETPIFWPPDAKSWRIWDDPDAGKDRRQEKKGMTEDEMVGWQHWLNGCGFGWTPGVGNGQGGLAGYSSWGCKELVTTERLNWTELRWFGEYREFEVVGREGGLMWTELPLTLQLATALHKGELVCVWYWVEIFGWKYFSAT